MRRATLLLPNFNNGRALPVVFESFLKQLDCSRLEMVLVDDGSEDDGVAVAKRCAAECDFGRVEILESPHRGIVFALNDGLAAVRTEYVIRVDGDATVESPGWAERLLAPLHFPEVGLVTGQVLWESGEVHSFGRSVFSETGLHDGGCVPLEPVGQRTFDSIVHRPRRGFLDGPPREVDTALGICVAFRKADADAIGGFDRRFNPVWLEDDDFGVAMRQMGKRVILEPAVRVVHRPSLRGSRTPGVMARRLRRMKQGWRPRLGLARSMREWKRRAGKALRCLASGVEASPEDLIPREREPWRREILQGHYRQWREKWGFDPLNPDMMDVFGRYWDTALCWRNNPRQLEGAMAFGKRLAAWTPDS